MSASVPLPQEREAELRELAARVACDSWVLSDCEGWLKIWREQALTHVTRDKNGEINGFSEPSSYRVTDLIFETELDSWDPGEDATDDQVRADINVMFTARLAVPELLAEIDRLRAELSRAGKDTGVGSQPTAGESTQPAELTVYRASHDSIVMGLYTTREAAQHHCEASESGSDALYRGAVFAWHEDEEDGVVELYATFAPRSMPGTPTGYVVTPLTVASEYDEEDDE